MRWEKEGVACKRKRAKQNWTFLLKYRWGQRNFASSCPKFSPQKGSGALLSSAALYCSRLCKIGDCKRWGVA